MKDPHSLALLGAAIIHRQIAGFRPFRRPTVAQVPIGHRFEAVIEEYLGRTEVGHPIVVIRDPRLDPVKTAGKPRTPGMDQLMAAIEAFVAAGQSKKAAAANVSSMVASYLRRCGVDMPSWVAAENLRREYYRHAKQN